MHLLRNPAQAGLKPSLPCVKGGGTACRDGGIVKSDNLHKTIPQSASLTAPFTQGSLFLFTYGLFFQTRVAHITAEGNITHEVHITRRRRIELAHLLYRRCAEGVELGYSLPRRYPHPSPDKRACRSSGGICEPRHTEFAARGKVCAN